AANDAGKLTEAQRNIFWNPCPAEELYRVSLDPHQLSNLATDPAFQEPLETARALLVRWTEETGDTLPENPTPDRNTRSAEMKKNKGHRHLEMPGDVAGATEIEAAGPVTL
ncbi:MAG: heparan N-sulfatase, partial [Planctomycetota bacterium]